MAVFDRDRDGGLGLPGTGEAAERRSVQVLLRDRIIETYNHYNDKGYCPIYAKESMRRLYAAYHALGGNDVATELKEKLLEMPAEMKWEAEMRSTRPPVI